MSFTEYVKAGSPLICVRTHEEVRALTALQTECENEEMIFKRWDVITGGEFGTTDPSRFLAALSELQDPEYDVIFALDIHSMLDNPTMIRAMKLAMAHISNIPISIVLIAPGFKLPDELSKDNVVFDFELPTVAGLRECAESILKENDMDLNVSDDILISARGMTMPEAINAFSLSLAAKGEFDKKLILHEKLQSVRKSGLMEIYEAEPESNVGGMKELKAYVHSRKIGFTDPSYPTPTGMLMVGPPGAGKSLASKMIANILDVPLLRLDFSSMKSKYVGDSEARVKQVLALIDAVSPCVVWLDRFCSTKIV